MMTVHFIMGPPAVSLVLVVALGLTAMMPGITMVNAEGNSVAADESANRNTAREQQNNECADKTAAIQRRQDLTDTRLNGLDSRVNRIDSRLDGIETALTDMKDFLQTRMEAMGEKVEWALTGVKHRPDGYLGETKQVSYLLPLVQGDFRPLRTPEVHKGCQEALRDGWTTSGIYHITPDHNTSLDVFCEQQLDGGGWMVFQARKDGSINFYRDWNTYRQGFGELTGEFWLGNTNIHLLTKHHDQQLKIELISPEGDLEYADYSRFSIDDESHKYRLNVSGYSGGSPPGDSLTHQNGASFSTKDQDNDIYSTSCATQFHGAWWYKKCHYSNLNGLYGSREYAKGLTWYHWKGYHVSNKATRMMIRRRP